jgi:hypothetical protein
MEKFIHENVLFAILVRKDFHREGVSFVTDGTGLLEMGYMSHPAGHAITPHKHLPYPRQTLGTQEVLFLKSGKVRVDFYSDQDICVGSRELGGGDWIILLAGGHGFEILETSVLFEVKNGPYAGDKDKVRFQPIQSEGIS